MSADAEGSSFTQQKIITVCVGPKKKPFQLHRQLLIDKSPYFETRLKACWEGSADKLELDDFSVEGFEIVVDWMYTNEIPERLRCSQERDSDAIVNALHTLLLPAYQAADMLMIADLQNKLVDLEIELFHAEGQTWSIRRVKTLHRLNLAHTPYYDLVIKSSVGTLSNLPLTKRNATTISKSSDNVLRP